MGRLGKVDPSSFAEVEKITTVHSDLKWKVDFANKKIVGSVVHKFNVLEKNLPSIVSILKFFRALILEFYL